MRDQSTLDPASHAADKIADLWWILFAVSAVVFAVVVTLLLVGVLRARGDNPSNTVSQGLRADRRPSRGGTRLIAIAGVVVPAVVVIALFFASVATLPAVSPSGKDVRMTIEVVGRQWFWDVYYDGGAVRTANEIHVPAGVPVELRVRSEDVIHSLWVPRLNRKIDLIPGRTSSIVIDARKPGFYRGQCAEFCGVQHANMALLVVADPPAQFTRWLDEQKRPSSLGVLFTTAGCDGCHALRGTEATSRFGPDLSHLGSRHTLAAGTLRNTPQNLAAWIRDPQAIKPGNKMPNLHLSDEDVDSLVDYLEGQP
jgi:cytochrome c oxidase subunit 2